MKAIPFTAWDESGKIKSWNWSKLMTRIKGASFDITENMNFEPDSICAIMIPNSEPFSFIVAYFGCLFSRVKPLPIELPITNSRNGLTARFGTLLRTRFSQHIYLE